MIDKNLERRLLFILHRGFVDARLLAQAGKQQQLFDLADALEPLPGWIAGWRDEYLNALKENLAAYSAKYADAFRYDDFLHKYEPPTF